jgi:hypothetical protein
MFSLFWDQPLYHTYYAYDPFAFRRTPSRRTRYLNYLENRLASLINDEFDDFWDSPPQKKQVQHDQSPSQSPVTPSGEGQPQPQSQSQSPPPTETQQPAEKKSRGLTEYHFQSRATYNGRDYVEEHRERFTGEDGGIHVRTRRRLGDRWYEIEDHTDADGKKSQRETWHNVGDDQIESFKQEWTERYQLPAAAAAPASTSTSAIKQQPPAVDGEGSSSNNVSVDSPEGKKD